MKIKKLSTALAVMPFGIAAASTAPYSVPHYGNVSLNDTAAINPYVYLSCSRPVLPHLHVSLFPTLDHSLQRRSHWPLLNHAERLLGPRHDACAATTSTPHHSTPHSAKYQVFAGIKIRQNVIPTNRQQQGLKSRQIFLSICYHDFHQLVRHLDQEEDTAPQTSLPWQRRSTGKSHEQRRTQEAK
jgi:hypothetical protein